jgi:plastocyanin
MLSLLRLKFRILPSILTRGRWMAIVCIAALSSSCGGSSPAGPSGGEATIMIGPSGVSPMEIRIKVFDHVVFVNNDARPHSMMSDPYQTHDQCPAINYVGFLSPGERRASLSFTEPRVCGFHDHNNEFDTSLQGRIIVQ